MSHHPAFTLGGLCAIGGAIGYSRTRSRPSLIAGLAFGALYSVSGYLLQQNAEYGAPLAAVTSALLLGSMGPRALRTRKPVPIMLAFLGTLGSAYYGKLVYEGYYGV
ncbi:transmembrane proteins 14C-domain-containing protein [Fimicolochytrium jonesii]|uniref:transmembrane proteins 14C-domain-containing protein n=1 Tax=Fimicolochytrium jonesii TaxID=1396493 RepID=UPI0022FDC2AC|nr:transmembrane proteins 14C-domain-containing protein [Fimicolochytrium jonesii]KAI8826044.1 transmembrane proteins 14C-domain-containing protein [Fimicolochytrium jonesii]